MAASFDCAKATTGNEKMICGSSKLSLMDERYAELYTRAKAQLPNGSQIKQDARAALRLRESVCKDSRCLGDWFQNRIITLSNKILMPETCFNPQPHTTRAMNRCAADEVDVAKGVMNVYYDEVIERHSSDQVVLRAIESGQAAWQAYSEAHCRSVHDKWRDGSIRTLMYLRCELDLINRRTAVLWESFLTFADSTPALLPEPYPLFTQNE